MPLYQITSSNTTLSFWVLNRVFESSVLFIAPLMRNKNFTITKVSSIFAFISAFIIFIAMKHPLELFIQNEGLTTLKVSFEYFIIFILLCTLYINKKYSSAFKTNIYKAIRLSIVLTIFAELSFMLYTDMYGIMNTIGHILKFLSFWILLQAIIKASLSDPFSLMQKGASTYNAIPFPAVVVDKKGIIQQVNHASCKFLHKTHNQIIENSNHDLFHPSNLNKSVCPICQAIKNDETLKEHVLHDLDTNKYIEFTLTPIRNIDNNLQGVVQVSIDITAKRILQNTITGQFKLLENIVNTIPIRIFWKDKESSYLGANNLFLQDAKLNTQNDIIGKNDFDMIWAETEAQIYRDDDLLVMNSNIPKLHFEESQTDELGNIITLSTSKVPLKDSEGNTIGVIGLYEDVSHKKEMEKKIVSQAKELQHQAMYDSLTNLPNRYLFQDRLQHSIEKSKRNSNEFALLFIDLDQFKQINDSLGHQIGDEVLKEIAQRLQKTLRKEDSLSRIGGDEFTIIANNINSVESISSLSQKIIETTNKPIKIKEHTLYVSSSIGISLYPSDSENFDDLIKYADAAMYKAKDEGRNNFQYYYDDMTQKAIQKVQMLTKLKEAIKNEDFLVYYQPQVDIKNKKVIGLEALVRWKDSNEKMMYPDVFIPLAEETGLIVELDRIVMIQAIHQIEIWRKEKIFDGMLSLNLAMKQLEKNDFLKFIQNYDNLHKIELEVTESGLMEKPQSAIKKLNELKNLGIKISIDDFGTGYSSLAYLKKLPISKIKIDCSFVEGLPHDLDDASIVKAIISLAHNLDLEVLAEGVETQEQNDFMLDNGCNIIQGYFYSKPMSSFDTEKFLKSF